jgi:hypothetical protein
VGVLKLQNEFSHDHCHHFHPNYFVHIQHYHMLGITINL